LGDRQCLAYSSLPVGSNLQLGLQVDCHLVQAHVHSSDPSELSPWLCHDIDYITINIVFVIIIIVGVNVLSCTFFTGWFSVY